MTRTISPSDALLELAERCEAATAEQQHTLLDDAYHAVFPKPESVWVTDNTGPWTDEYSAHHERSWHFREFLDAGAFVDAALTLVPEGLDPQICKGPMFALAANEARPWGVSLIGPARDVEGEFGPEIDYDSHDANAATAALAICAASLRARAAQ